MVCWWCLEARRHGVVWISLRVSATAQIALDLAALLVAVHYTGGLASPLLVFFGFHMAIGTILVATDTMYVVAGLTSLGGVGLYLMESTGLLGRHPLSSAFATPEIVPVLGLLSLVGYLFGIVYLTGSVTDSIEAAQRRVARDHRRPGAANLRTPAPARRAQGAGAAKVVLHAHFRPPAPLAARDGADGARRDERQLHRPVLATRAAAAERRVRAGGWPAAYGQRPAGPGQGARGTRAGPLGATCAPQPAAGRPVRRALTVRRGAERPPHPGHRRRGDSRLGGAAGPGVRLREPGAERHQGTHTPVER